MRIGFDVRALLDRPISGIGEYAIQLLRGMTGICQSADEIVLFANAWRGVPELELPASRARITRRFSKYPNKILNTLFWILRHPTIDAFTGPVDVMFAPNMNFLPLCSNIPLVVTVHDLSFIHYPTAFSLRRRLWHTLVGPKSLFARADAIIAVSHATARDAIQTLGVPKERVHVVYSGVNRVTVGSDDKQRVQTAFALSKPFILSLSTIEPRKNLITVLDAYTQLRERGYKGQLVFAGRGGWLSGPFERILREHPYRGDIRYLGYVTETEKAVLYNIADVFVYPSVFEGFGFPPIEALVQGTPVVAGAHSSLSELVGDTATLVDIHNVNDVAEALWQTVSDPAPVPDEDRQRLLEKFSWERAAHQTMEILQTTAYSHAHRH